MKRQLMEWENICKYLSDKELIPKYIYNSYNSIVKKNSVKKGAEEQNFLSKEDTKNRHMTMLDITNHQGIHIKTTIRSHLISVRMAVIRRQEVTNVGKDVEKREPSFTVGWGM